MKERLPGWKTRLQQAGINTVYGFLAAATIWPVMAAYAQGDLAAIMALGNVLAGVGGNLLAERIQRWKDATDETDMAEEIAQEAAENQALRAEIDQMLAELEALSLAEAALSEEDKAWFRETLAAELERLGNLGRFEATLIGSGAIAQGPGAKAVGERGMLIEGDVQGDIIITTEAPDRHPRVSSEPGSQALQSAYLNWLIQQTGFLSLEGIDPQSASQAETRLRLSEVYTALLTLTPEAHERLERGEIGNRDVRRRSVLEELNDHPRLVLLGDPGSGKSTFVNFVSLCLAGERLGRDDANLRLLIAPLPDDDGDDQDERQPWDHGPLLPVRIVLRDFAARGLPAPDEKATVEHLWRFITEELREPDLADYAPALREHLLEQGGIFLFDGLDEVPEAEQRRDQIRQVIHAVAAAFPKCRVVVTSRVYAYRRQDWTLNDFAITVLTPFSRGQIIRFVDRWYAHIARLRGQQPEDAQGRAALLKRAILGNERLYELAQRPLLLTLMASLHAWRGGALPEKREQLYNDTVELLLDRWEGQRVVRDQKGNTVIMQPSLAEFLKVGKERIRQVLNELAYEAHARQPELVGTADIREAALVEKLMRISENPDVRPRRLVEFLRDRAGLLVSRGVGVYTFPHRTFQEYLAACYLTDYDYPYEVARLAKTDPERWREVALLAGAKAGRGTSSAVWVLADALCEDEPPEEDADLAWPDVWGAHLAGQLLVESADLNNVHEPDRRKMDRARRWLVRVIRHEALAPTERAIAGDNLAHLGDPRPGVGLNEEGLPDILWSERIEPGPFVMGNTKETDEMAYGDEAPQFTCRLITRPYRISRYPITVAQYRAFIEAGGYRERRYWTRAGWAWKEESGITGPEDYGEPFNLDNHPQVGVSWYEAVAFTRWLSERTGLNIRLPTEAQWERAARHTDGRRYPWSPDPQAKPDPNRMNYGETGIGGTSAVGCFPGGKAECGAEDMSGNVWEWCSTKRRDDYNNYEEKVDDELEGDEVRVLRGGSFYLDLGSARCAFRFRDVPYVRGWYFGFRVVLLPSTSEL
ncbi:MAG: SUMF1/EgtB/PvdO family nonheme iron enzyme [Chloroflexi bacterium]|nr:SUMF1/EgtB/PvdO family nonheme iron enzyme [Chloroflexota bacterium]